MMRFFILLLSLFLLFPQAANAALVGWWKMDEASWNGTANEVVDSAGTNHGTAGGGATTKVGKIDRTGSFDGSNDYVRVGNTGMPTNTFTFGAWIKASVTHEIDTETNVLQCSGVGIGGTSGQKYVFEPRQSGSNGGAGLSVGTNGISVYEHGDCYMPAIAVYSATIGTGWNHIVVVYNNKQPTIYLNGVAVRTGLTSQKTTVYAPMYDIGGMVYGFFPGSIDDVRIYSHALTANEVAELYYSGAKTRIRNATLRNMTIGTTTTWTCGDSITVAHTAGNISPVTVNITYGTVSTAITGATKCWITRNLGATTQATSATDNTDASAGWYWQFNRKQGYGNSSVYPPTWTVTPAWTITSISEDSNWSSANDPCTLLLGTGWRLPTSTEWTNADGSPQNWANYNDTYASVLKIHAAGYLGLSDGALYSRGSLGSGIDWGSTQASSTNGWNLYFTSSLSYMANYAKAYGFSVRCLKD